MPTAPCQLAKARLAKEKPKIPWHDLDNSRQDRTFAGEMENKSHKPGNHQPAGGHGLGNVHLTLSDYRRKEEDGLGVAYYSQINSASDYYPFGMLLTDGNYSSGSYRFGFNSQEKDDDIYGQGNSYSAEFWQYDARLGRRWNVDPVNKPHESSYASFANNPVWFVDPFGLDSIQLNRDGTTNLVATTDDDFDVYIGTDKKGNLDRSKTHILYNEDVRDRRTDTQDYKEKNKETGKKETKTATIDFYEIDDYDKAKDFFEFAADNTDVEWAHTIIGSSTRSVVTTSHLEKGEASGLYFFVNNYYIVDRRHSQPNNWHASKQDRDNVPLMNQKYPKSKLFYIYYKGNYYQYNDKRTSKAPNQIPQSY